MLSFFFPLLGLSLELSFPLLPKRDDLEGVLVCLGPALIEDEVVASRDALGDPDLPLVILGDCLGEGAFGEVGVTGAASGFAGVDCVVAAAVVVAGTEAGVEVSLVVDSVAGVGSV